MTKNCHNHRSYKQINDTKRKRHENTETQRHNDLNKGSYMSAHVLLNLLNEFNKFNNSGARMLGFIYHMTLKFIKIAFLACKRQYFAIFYATL